MRSAASLDRLVRERHLLKHPFYTAWSCGELPLETLQDYTQQYYRFEANFPRYVAGTYARIEDPSLRRPLLENLIDEEGRDRTHPQLWLDFARGIHAESNPARLRPERRATRALCHTYERLTLRGTAAEGLGALYAYESQFPEVAREKSRGLRAHYGITSKSAHEFFRIHSFADVEHAAAERAVLRRVLQRSPAALDDATRGVRSALTSWWRFLDQFQN